jgi:hypothetical protein
MSEVSPLVHNASIQFEDALKSPGYRTTTLADMGHLLGVPPNVSADEFIAAAHRTREKFSCEAVINHRQGRAFFYRVPLDPVGTRLLESFQVMADYYNAPIDTDGLKTPR